MKFEIRKLLNKRYVVLLLFIVVGVSILLGFFSGVRQTNVTIKGETYTGRTAAIKVNDIQQKMGNLTVEKLNKVLNFYKKEQKSAGTDAAYLKTEEKYPGILQVISEVYFPNESLNAEGLLALDNVDDFNTVRSAAIKKTMEITPKLYNDEDFDRVNEIDQDNGLPIKYGLDWLWESYFRIMNVVILLCIFSIILLCSDMFTYEKNRKMNLILDSLNRHGRSNIFISKCLASVIVSTVLYFVSITFMTIAFWQFMKIPSSNSPIQLVYILSIYKGTIGSALIKLTLYGWLSAVTVCVVTIVFNKFLNNTILTIGISCILFFIPIIFSSFSTIPARLYSFMAVQPLNNCICERCLTSLHLYTLGKTTVYGMGKTCEICIIYIIIAVLFTLIEHITNTRKRGY